MKVVLNDERTLTPHDANDPEFVKSLLDLQKEDAVAKLLLMIPLVRKFHNITRITYLQILPVFFSYAIVLNRTIAPLISRLIDMVMSHKSFSKDKNLFVEWKARIQAMNSVGSKGSRVAFNFERNLKNRYHLVIINGTDFVDPICYTEIDYFISFHRYLKFHKLHKYLFFFGNLSFYEIQVIDSGNIRDYEQRVNIFPMTEGARNAILRKLADLKFREQRLTIISHGMKINDIEWIKELVEELHSTIRTPIRGNENLLLETGERLPQLFSDMFEKLTSALIQHICSATNEIQLKRVTLVSESACNLLRKAWACYFFEPNERDQINNLRRQIERSLRIRKPGMIKFAFSSIVLSSCISVCSIGNHWKRSDS